MRKASKKPASAAKRGKTPEEATVATAEQPSVALVLYVPPPQKPRTRAQIVLEALDAMGSGTSIRQIAKREGMVFGTLHRWLTVPELASQYARAREAQATYWVERALAVASGLDEDQRARMEAMVDSIATAEDDDKDRLLSALAYAAIQRDKLHVDTLKWTASKFYPRQFGDTLGIDVTSKGESLAEALREARARVAAGR